MNCLLKLYCAGVLLLFASNPTLGTEGWELRMDGIPSVDVSYNWAAVVDANTIWIHGGTYPKTLVYRSVDFGKTWIDANPYPDSTGLPWPEVGAIAAWDDLEAVVAATSGRIYRTTDGGVNWTVVFEDSGVTTFLNYMEMVDDTHGFALGDAPAVSSPAAVLKTTDAGWTWTPIEHDLPTGCYQLFGPTCDFVNREVGYALQGVPNYTRTVFKTTDGGTTWKELPEIPGIVIPICFVDESTGFVADMYQQPGIHKTTNGGTSWQFVKSAPPLPFIGCAPAGARIWACGEGVLASDDRGDTWYSQEVRLPSGGRVEYGSFLSKDLGVLVGANTVLVTTNGGIVAEAVHEGQLPTEYVLHQNYPNPFNPTTTIEFSLARASHVSLKVYDVLGQEILTLVNAEKPAGVHRVDFDGSSAASGVSFYRMQAENNVQTKRFMLQK